MILKIIIILILIIGLFYVLFSYLEKFSNKNYINTKLIPFEYNQIYSSVPYDIIIKNENSIYYDYGNDELNEKFIKVYDINQNNLIKMIEGIEWTKWNLIDEKNYSIKLENYLNRILKDFEKKLNNHEFKLRNNPNFKIIKNTPNRFKISLNDNDVILLDIDIIIYRNNKPLARHIKLLAVSNGLYINYLFIKIIGVIKECDLSNQLSSSNEFDNNYSEFINNKKIIYDMNSFIYDTNDKLVNSTIQNQLYNKLLKDLI